MRENVVERSTYSRTQQMLQSCLPNDLVAAMPSSFGKDPAPPPSSQGGTRRTPAVSFRQEQKPGLGSAQTSGDGQGVPSTAYSEPPSIYTSGTIGSRLSKKVSDTAVGPLLGPVSVLLLRVEGQVYTLHSVATLLDKHAPREKQVLPQLAVPVQRRFIPTLSDLLEGKTSEPARGAVSALLRQTEVRDIAQFVLGEVLRGVLEEQEVHSYVKEVVSDEASGLQWPESLHSVTPVGQPVYPIYLEDTLSAMPLDELLVTELKLMGVTDASDSKNTNKQTKGVELLLPDSKRGVVRSTCSLDALDPDLEPSPWTIGYRALLRGSRHFLVRKADLLRALRVMSLSPKGLIYKTMESM